MKIKIPYKSVVICSIFLGVLISIQFKTINLENEGMTTSKRRATTTRIKIIKNSRK